MPTSQNINPGFGERLSAALRVANVSQTRVAAELGVNASTVSNWVNNTRTPGDEPQMVRLAELAGVSAAWLRTGAGPVPAGVRRQETEQAQARLGWYAKRVGADGAREGGNAALFAISPTLGHVVREAIQNSIDARLGAGPVTVALRLLSLRGGARQRFLAAIEFEELKRHLHAAVDGTGDQQIGRRLREGLDLDSEGELLVLEIIDQATRGLIGPERGAGNFPDLTKNTLFSSKQSSTAGGSHGLGKATQFAASRVNTVLYLSDLSEPDEQGRTDGRFIGRTELAWHELDGVEYAGPMWYGERDEPAVSRWLGRGDVVLGDLRMTRPEGTGTTVAIVGLRDLDADAGRTPAETLAEIGHEIARHFWPALQSGALDARAEYLEISDPDTADELPGPGTRVRPLDVGDVAPLALARATHRDGGTVEQLVDDGDVVRAEVELDVPARRDRTHARFVHRATVLVRRALPDELEAPADASLGRVALLRGAEMVVRQLDARRAAVGARAFQAVVLCGLASDDDPEHARWAEEFLRAAEPPAHDRWEYTESLRLDYQRGASVALKRFENSIHAAIRGVLVHERETDDHGPDDLARRFRFGVPEPGDRAPRLRLDSRSIDDGSWQITGTVRLRDQSKRIKGRPVIALTGETGRRTALKWRELEAVRDCRVEDGLLVIDAGTRSARFRAVSDSDSTSISPREAAVGVAFHVVEERS